MHYLGQYVLPYVLDGKLQCCTEFILAKGHKYRAHPSIYDGEPWHDHAMLEWPNYKYPHPLPAFIHTFIDLRDLAPSTRIIIPEVGQVPIKAGVYAVVHSFFAADEVETRMDSNTMTAMEKEFLERVIFEACDSKRGSKARAAIGELVSVKRGIVQPAWESDDE